SLGAGLTYGAGALWLTLGSDVARVDPQTGRVLRRFATGPRWLTFGDGAAWAVDPGNGVVTKIDPVENKIAARTKLHGWASDVAIGGGIVWGSGVPARGGVRVTGGELGVQ